VAIIQFNSILYYLCAEPTAPRPITDTAQCRYRQLNRGQTQYKAKDKLQEITGRKKHVNGEK
jgi:hypothetical protein